MKPICRTNRRPFRPGFLSHLRSFNGYDGPEILPSSTRHFCLIGADAGQPGASFTIQRPTVLPITRSADHAFWARAIPCSAVA